MADMQIVPAGKNVEPQYVEMKVPLYSYGCEKKIKKALSNFKGIYSVDVDFNQQKVTVWGICNKNDVLETVRSKRKGACFWNSNEDNTQLVEQDLKPQSASVSNYLPKRNFRFNRSLTLAKAKSLSMKASLSLEHWKKKLVFDRSYSFS